MKAISPNLAKFYGITSYTLEQNPEIAKRMNNVIKYEIGDDVYLTIDMRENSDMQITVGKTDTPANATFRMSAETFDGLYTKELKGYSAFLSGKVKIDGKAPDKFIEVMKWDNIVVSEYTEKIDVSMVPGL